MLILVRTTSTGARACRSYGEDTCKLNYLDATVLACAISGATLSELSSAIETEYPMPITNVHLLDKVAQLERLGFVACLREINDDAMLIVKYEKLVFKLRLSTLVAMNPQIDGNYIKGELPYHREVIVKPDNSTVFSVRLA